MVDVGDKEATRRSAVADGFLRLEPATVARLEAATLAKGDALAVARVAGIAAAKRTSDLLPLAHPIAICHAAVRFELEAGGVRVEAEVASVGPTGVEMEAMTAVAVAALTLYDMVKSSDRSAVIERVQLLEKRGGRSGTYRRSAGG